MSVKVFFERKKIVIGCWACVTRVTTELESGSAYLQSDNVTRVSGLSHHLARGKKKCLATGPSGSQIIPPCQACTRQKKNNRGFCLPNTDPIESPRTLPPLTGINRYLLVLCQHQRQKIRSCPNNDLLSGAKQQPHSPLSS